MTPEIWTLEDVAEFLRVSVDAVANLAKESQIPHFRVGDAIRFRKDQIIRWTEGEAPTDSPPLSPPSHSDDVRGRNEWHLSRNKSELFIRLVNPRSAIAYSLIPLSKGVRHFFPGYKVPFTMETISGDIETRITSASDGAKLGAHDEGNYVQGGLTEWFRRHKKEIESGLCLRIRQVEKGKKYRLDLVPSKEIKSAMSV